MTRRSCRAWLLPLSGGRHAAIGEQEMVHIIPEWVRLQPIPYSPGHCHKVFIWQGQLIPVFDLHAYIHPQDVTATDTALDVSPIISIVAYTDADDAVGFGGLLLGALPFRTDVVDDQLCDFPDSEDRWQNIAVSCFSDPAGGSTPVLDLPRIFGSAPTA